MLIKTIFENATMLGTIVGMYRNIDANLSKVTVTHTKSKFNSPKSCFYNAQRLALSKPGAKYVLGFYLFGGIPLEHAWVKIGTEYMDSTLEPHEGITSEYYSVVELDQHQLKQLIAKIGDGHVDLYNVNRYLTKIS
jgi:hypothetical protein